MSDISVGDKMLVRVPGIGGSVSIARVDKVLKRYFVCAGRKWEKDRTMRCIGGNTWYMPTIRRATDADEVAIAAGVRRHKVVHYDWKSADQSIIDAVLTIISQQPNTPSTSPATGRGTP